MSRAAIASIDDPAPAQHSPAAAADVRTLEPLVVVGNGMVGHRLCRRLVELGATDRYRIVVFGEERQPAYDRVHLTDLLAGRNEDDLLLAPESWYRGNGIELHLGDPVIAIDRERRLVRSASGREIEYSRLVLATGSSPYVPPLDGSDLAGVFVYRTVQDVRAMRARARHAATAAVIGGGLLGLEAARALQRCGLRVTVVEAAASLMPAQLDQAGGEELERQVTALGIEVRTGTMTTRIEPAGAQRTLHFVGGTSVTVDIVVIAAGVRPRTQLASACGLSRSPEGGVIVDDALRTSDPGIFAVGECASHRSQIYGLVAPGYEMADALALILAGSQASFRGASPSTRLKLLGVEVATAGDALDRGFAVRFHTATAYRLVRVERGRLVGALGVGEWPELRRVQEAAARHGRVWPWQIARFARTGILWQRDADSAVADWPAHAVVCNCLNVTHGRIMAACAERAVSVESVVERTGASTLCGTCRPLLAQLVEGRAPSPRLATGLLAGSVAALGIAIAILTVTPIPLAGSIQAPSWADVLWREGTNRQISGFVLLALMVLTSSLTLRRRWRRLSSVGTYATWRIAHVLLGIGTLAGVAVHTGARLGDNLTFALMACFGALNVAGAAAGGLTALEARVGTPSVRRYRAALVTVHIAAIWPLPILIAFHVLTVFYF